MNSSLPPQSKTTRRVIIEVTAWGLGLLASCILFYTLPFLFYCILVVLLLVSLFAVATGRITVGEIHLTEQPQGGLNPTQIGLLLILIVFGCLFLLILAADLSESGPLTGAIVPKAMRILEATPAP